MLDTKRPFLAVNIVNIFVKYWILNFKGCNQHLSSENYRFRPVRDRMWQFLKGGCDAAPYEDRVRQLNVKYFR